MKKEIEKEMATHSSSLAWRILWTEEPGRLQPMGCKESDMPEPHTITECHMSPVNWIDRYIQKRKIIKYNVP